MVKRMIAGALGRNPIAFFFMVCICLPAGLSVLVGGPAPASIQSLLPTALLFTWGAILVFSGITSGFSYLWRGTETTSKLIEWVSVIPLSIAAIAYSIGILYVGGFGSLLAAGLTLAFSVVCFLRAEQIRKEINLYKWPPYIMKFTDKIRNLFRFKYKGG